MRTFTVEPVPPFQPPVEVAWTETGLMYHRLDGPGRTFCGAQVSYATGPERIQPGDEPCDVCFRVRT